ncbi:hypothetical protein Hamer_G026995 [Homarus americanus]|uniref:Uncharacterized protein n=1 Tax=Homarus americanus TaxID=6706 RepID=A0A8J5MK74_HOMAM|nr:hypothetical protein Hamer_G026995 [Homarus americanus]
MIRQELCGSVSLTPWEKLCGNPCA